MSYELIAVLIFGVIQVGGLLVMLRMMVLEVRELRRDHKAIAGLVVQESDKIQQLLRA